MLTFAIAMTVSTATMAQDKPAPEAFGPWTLTHETLADGKGFCRLARSWPADVYMEFASFGPGHAPVLSVINPRWDIAEKAVTPIIFEIDGTRRTLSAARVAPRQVIAGSADDLVTWIVDQMATAKTISAVLPTGESFNLDTASLAAAHTPFLTCATAWAGQSPATTTAKAASRAPTPRGTGGTGFAVTHDGTLVTNAHVIAGCPTILIGKRGHALPAVVLAEDKNNDLAALHVDGLVFDRVALIDSSGTVALGETVVTYGFPLYGALSTDGNFSIGYVSALSGMRDDPRHLQISTPVQAGNSGGPLLSATGSLIGVVASKLNAGNMLKIAGDTPENVNFAINAQTVQQFLDAYHISVTRATDKRVHSNVELAALSRDIAVHIDCRG